MPAPHRPSAAATGISWLGGAAFVAALAACGYFFAVTLGTPGPATEPVLPALAWNTALFAVFAAHHSVMARSGAKTWLARHAPPPLERSIYVWFASILLVGVTLLWRRVPGTVYVLTGSAAGLGWLLQAAGLALTAAGARVLSARALAGIHQAAGTAERGDIRMVWPYTLVRHPIYLGWALIMFGAPAMTVDRFVWAVVSTGYLILAMPWEERSLSAAAGPAYSAYCRKVRWRLVPWVY